MLYYVLREVRISLYFDLIMYFLLYNRITIIKVSLNCVTKNRDRKARHEGRIIYSYDTSLNFPINKHTHDPAKESRSVQDKQTINLF